MRRRDGTPIWVLENVSLLEGGEVLEGTIIDITDRKTAQEQMEYQAYHEEEQFRIDRQGAFADSSWHSAPTT